METRYEHSGLHGRPFWILAAVSGAGVVWLVNELSSSPWGFTDFEGLFLLGVVLSPFLMFGLPMLRHGRQSLRVDDEGVWRDGELLVAAQRIRTVGVHIRRSSRLDPRYHAMQGRSLREYRIHDVGPVLVPSADHRASVWLWGSLRPVVLVVEPAEDQQWLVRDGWHVGRLLVTRRERALVEALLAIAPQVDEPRQLLVPEVKLGMGHQTRKKLPTDEPPVEGWSWAEGARVP